MLHKEREEWRKRMREEKGMVSLAEEVSRVLRSVTLEGHIPSSAGAKLLSEKVRALEAKVQKQADQLEDCDGVNTELRKLIARLRK